MLRLTFAPGGAWWPGVVMAACCGCAARVPVTTTAPAGGPAAAVSGSAARPGAVPLAGLSRTGVGFTDAATPAAAIKTLPGFKVELIYSVPRETQGSWISLTIDDKDRLIASAQTGKGLYRITPPPQGAPAAQTIVERLDVDVGGAHGLLHAFGALYAVVAEQKDANGLYRLRDSDGDDRYDQRDKLLALRGTGEHGPHGIILSPDRQSLFMVGGNYTKLPEGIAVHLSPKTWAEDHLLPPVKDPAGHNRKPAAPGAGSAEGWVLQLDRDGKQLALHAMGLRNAYDIAFNRYGDLFTYDSDMEWDLGTSWYRPPRICLIPSGADFGWRFATGIYPPYQAETLPGVLDTGPASPTGVVFGYRTRFPARYQEALFALDWTYGTIHAVHLEPKGSAYQATRETFISGTPLPVTDAVVRSDGALYFITGGRGVQSGVYRVTYAGEQATAAPDGATDEAAADLRSLRHRLEQLHGKVNPRALAAALPFLGHPDRFIRGAARVVVEQQPVVSWQRQASNLLDVNPAAGITATVALARWAKPGTGNKSVQAAAVKALGRIDYGELAAEQRLEYLRALALVFVRLGQPSAAQKAALIARLDRHFPTQDDFENVELARILAFLDAPTVAAKTVRLMEVARAVDSRALAEQAARNDFYGASVRDMVGKSPHTQRMLLASMLRVVTQGWTVDLRRRYFGLIHDAMQVSRGGNLYYAGWQTIREEAIAGLPAAARAALAGVIGEQAMPPAQALELPSAKGPGSPWTVNGVWEPVETDPSLLRKRSFANGKQMFGAATCVLCHRVGADGGPVGPDLSGVGARFSLRDLLDAIVNPSAVISDQYQSSLVTLKEGGELAGRLVREDAREVVVMTNMWKPQELQTLARARIKSIEVSPMSQMPPGLINALNRDEVLDLVAYLIAGGDPRHAVFH